jgi:hypothetical protein
MESNYRNSVKIAEVLKMLKSGVCSPRIFGNWRVAGKFQENLATLIARVVKWIENQEGGGAGGPYITHIYHLEKHMERKQVAEPLKNGSGQGAETNF